MLQVVAAPFLYFLSRRMLSSALPMPYAIHSRVIRSGNNI